MQLRVKTLKGAPFTLTIDNDSITVLELKELISSEQNVDVDRQRLIYKGKVLKDAETLQSYGLQDGEALHLVVRQTQRPAPPPTSGATDAPTAPVAAPTPAPHVHSPFASSMMPGASGVMLNIPSSGPLPDLNQLVTNMLNSVGVGGGGAAAAGGGGDGDGNGDNGTPHLPMSQARYGLVWQDNALTNLLEGKDESDPDGQEEEDTIELMQTHGARLMSVWHQYGPRIQETVDTIANEEKLVGDERKAAQDRFDAFGMELRRFGWLVNMYGKNLQRMALGESTADVNFDRPIPQIPGVHQESVNIEIHTGTFPVNMGDMPSMLPPSADTGAADAGADTNSNTATHGMTTRTTTRVQTSSSSSRSPVPATTAPTAAAAAPTAASPPAMPGFANMMGPLFQQLMQNMGNSAGAQQQQQARNSNQQSTTAATATTDGANNAAETAMLTQYMSANEAKEWATTMNADRAAQRQQSPQGPLSSVYKNGSSHETKRRRINDTERKSDTTAMNVAAIEQTVMDDLRNAVSETPEGRANPDIVANVTRAYDSNNLRALYRGQLRTDLGRRSRSRDGDSK